MTKLSIDKVQSMLEANLSDNTGRSDTNNSRDRLLKMAVEAVIKKEWMN